MKSVIFIFFAFVVVSCSNNGKVNSVHRAIHLQESTDVLPISSFIKKLDYQEFKFPNGNIPMGEIERLKFIDGELLVEHRRAKDINLFRFSKDGTFKNKISTSRNTNSGVSNYKDIIAYQREYAILDENGCYRISKTGEYKGNLFDRNFTGSSFIFSNNQFYVFNELKHSGYLTEFDQNGKLKSKPVSVENGQDNPGKSAIISFGKNELHFFSPIIDTIFSFSENGLIPLYYFDGNPYPTYMQLADTIGDRSERERLKYFHTNKHVVVKNYLENKNYIFITYWVGSNRNNLIVNKNTWETTYFTSGVNDIDGGIWETPIYLSDEDVLYIPINSYKIGSHKILNKRKKDFQKLKDKFGVGDNPVLMLCKLK